MVEPINPSMRRILDDLNQVIERDRQKEKAMNSEIKQAIDELARDRRGDYVFDRLTQIQTQAETLLIENLADQYMPQEEDQIDHP